MSTKEEAQLIYSILDYPERVAETSLTVDEIQALLDRYSIIDDFDFTFAGSRKD